MATLGSSQERTSASPNRRRSLARRFERGCCSCITYLPLTFVYGLSTWAVWVQSSLGWQKSSGTWIALLGTIFYLMLNWCYTTAVFTDPGSPTNTSASSNPYTALPDQENYALSQGMTLTVKASGEMRFCKKCQTRKPDRAHHCSTCRRCVLKMDHHCPWLATCVGFRNYKPFILFLVYVCLFCYACFYATVGWIMAELFDRAAFEDQIMPVHYILLAVLSGIIGLVISGFTGWHLYLSITGQTTIESLEKTRYLTPIRKSMQQQLQQQSRHPPPEESSFQNLGGQLREIHANALPGVTRPEEGEDDRTSSPAQASLRQSYRDIERQREIDRYNDYLDETESDKLPNAFDLGAKRNIKHVFGENKFLWLLPICNTTGDGWQWEASQKWIEARDNLAKEREAQRREHDMFRADERGWVDRIDFRGTNSSPSRGSPVLSDGVSRSQPPPASGRTVPLQSFSTGDNYDEYATDEDDTATVNETTPFTPNIKHKPRGTAALRTGMSDMDNWNDIPDDIFTPRSKSALGRSSGAATPSRTGTPVSGARRGQDSSIGGGRKRSPPGAN